MSQGERESRHLVLVSRCALPTCLPPPLHPSNPPPCGEAALQVQGAPGQFCSSSVWLLIEYIQTWTINFCQKSCFKPDNQDLGFGRRGLRCGIHRAKTLTRFSLEWEKGGEAVVGKLSSSLSERL